MVFSPLITALLAVALFISLASCLLSWPIAWASPGCWARW